MNGNLVYLDLFSGIGGFAKGFADAGVTFSHHYFSEIDKHAIAVYKYNFNNADYVGDIRTISQGTIRCRPNIVTFGFPCQDLSIAGKRNGLQGARSGLFYEAIRLIELFKPEIFVIENVKGLLSSNKGKDFEQVLRAITNIGLYECEWQLLNTAWVLPQNRERIYLIGHLANRSTPKVFPFTKGCKEFIRERETNARQKDIAWSLRSRDHKDGTNFIAGTYRTYNDNSGFRQMQSNNCPTIPARARNDASGQPIVKNDTQIRRLTEIECERLQGFPDNWTKFGDYTGNIKEVSKTQRYKQLGNAVTTVWPKRIAERLFNYE